MLEIRIVVYLKRVGGVSGKLVSFTIFSWVMVKT